MANAEWNSTDRTYLENIQSITSQLQTDLNTLNQSISSPTDPLAIRTQLHSISVDIDDVADSAYNIDHTHLPQILALLRSIAAATNQTPHVHITNSVNVSLHAEDALAGNPWWATNSAFSLVRSKRGYSRPTEQPDGTYTYSFPQFMSYWSSALTLPYTVQGTSYSHAQVKQNWFDWLGVNRLPTRSNYTEDDPYTWFDWQVDAMRSNLVSQGSYNSELLRAINSLTNSFSFSPSFRIRLS